MASHSSILAWKSHGNPWWAMVHGVTTFRHDLMTKPPPSQRVSLKSYLLIRLNNEK